MKTAPTVRPTGAALSALPIERRLVAPDRAWSSLPQHRGSLVHAFGADRPFFNARDWPEDQLGLWLAARGAGQTKRSGALADLDATSTGGWM